jgi:hypothetical protein
MLGKRKVKNEPGPWIDEISVQSIELSIKLTEGGIPKIRQGVRHKLEYCVKVWSGEVERSNFADHIKEAAEASSSPTNSQTD